MAYQKALIALSNPTRCLILERLRAGPASVGKIASHIPVTRPAVSQHLKALKEAGLVDDWAMGSRRLYRLNTLGLVELRAWLSSFPGVAERGRRRRS